MNEEEGKQTYSSNNQKVFDPRITHPARGVSHGVMYLFTHLLCIRNLTQKERPLFFDGQNLLKSAEEAFGITYPNFSPGLLAEMICQREGWNMSGIYFYTGIPGRKSNVPQDIFWQEFWRNKLNQMKRSGIITYSRELRYGREKGIDIRIAVDMIRLARTGRYDVGLLFSQDQDFSEVVKEIKAIPILR